MRLLINYGREKEFPVGDLDRPMSGIRSAALGLTGALARRGHEVHLVAPCPNPGLYGGVYFHDRSEFARVAASLSPDVLVAIPEVLPLLMPVAARARVVWTGNAFPQGDAALRLPPRMDRDNASPEVRLYGLGTLLPLVDRVVVGSEWHAHVLMDTVHVPPETVRVRALGVPLECYTGSGPERRRHRLVYTSQARRGLHRLLELFPSIRAVVPESELHIYGYEYGSHGRPSTLEQADMPGVVWKGRMTKSDLAQELRAATVLAYPGRFRETFCLAIAEAQAAGLPVVTSDLAALSERVHDGVDGFLIRHRPKKPEYAKAFVDHVTQLLSDDELWRSMSEAARRHAFDTYQWDTIAAAWEADLEQLTAGREAEVPAIESTFNLLAPDLLAAWQGGLVTHIPAFQAERAVRWTWSTYGYDPASVPGLPAVVHPVRAARSSV